MATDFQASLSPLTIVLGGALGSILKLPGVLLGTWVPPLVIGPCDAWDSPTGRLPLTSTVDLSWGAAGKPDLPIWTESSVSKL